jgi:predicted ATPase/DNA-binding SARP family transcriptional activator
MTATETPSDAARLELPVHLTRFIGRDRELHDLASLLHTARLLTLTGAGGSGKTRLARETALHATTSFSRIAWADLAPLNDAELLAQQVAASLHLAERTGASPRELIVGAIGVERVLLVLDNCEHLVDACAELAEALLRACPHLTILATSRQALGVTSETAWLVPPLASAEALQLFAERARAVAPTFALNDANAGAVAEICRRLDGIPLAIELAAARVRVLTVEQIAHRLDDAFRLLTGGSRTALPRHRTLRATMEWSYALLNTREQVLLRRLAVFAGTFSLDAAEAICIGDPLEAEDILDGVSALVEKSLVVMEAGERVARYRVLETVRQYGLERLTEANELEALEAKHAQHFLEVIEAAAPLLFGGEVEPGLLAKLTPDNDNLRAAAAWSVRESGRARVALRFADAFFWYWYGATMGFGAGLFREGRRFIHEALHRASSAECDPFLRGRALASIGLIGLAQGDYEVANEALGESLALLREHGDETSLIYVLSKYGATRLMLGDLDSAWALLEEAYTRVDAKRPDTIVHSFAYSWRGVVARARGDMATARVMHEANLRVGRYLKNRTSLGHGYAFLAAVDLADGRVDDAFAHFCEALPYHLDLGDGWGLALDIEGFSAVAQLRGRHADSVRLLGAVDALRERSAVALPASDAADRARRIALARSRVGDSYDALYAEGRALSIEEMTRVATDESIVHTAEHRIVMPESLGLASAAAPDTVGRRPLKVLALGALQVFVDGRPVDQAAWGSARPRELLVYLLMYPEGRTKEQAGLAFWPDASPTQLRNNFHVTLHRLRKALGNADWVSLVGERYRIDPSVVVDEFDAVSFERDVVAARRAIRRQAPGAAAQLEQAVALYRGDFLDGEPAGDWHIEHRDRLQRLYVDALMELGAQYVKEERHAKATEVYRRVLARDELHEDALRALMRALAESGDRSQALRVYKRFSERLRSEMDAEPARETTRLVEQLQGAVA